MAGSTAYDREHRAQQGAPDVSEHQAWQGASDIAGSTGHDREHGAWEDIGAWQSSLTEDDKPTLPGVVCVTAQDDDADDEDVHTSKRTEEPSQNMSKVNFSKEPWLVWSRQTFDLEMKKSVIHAAGSWKKKEYLLQIQ